jgi:hypothetical protein
MEREDKKAVKTGIMDEWNIGMMRNTVLSIHPLFHYSISSYNPQNRLQII